MAKNLASVKPTNRKFMLDPGGYLCDWSSGGKTVPCTLLTTARYKKLMDVVKAAQNTYGPTPEMYAALKAAEKAGAL